MVMVGLTIFNPNFSVNSQLCLKSIKSYIEVTHSPPASLEVALGDTISIVCAGMGHGQQDPMVYWVKGLGPAPTFRKCFILS